MNRLINKLFSLFILATMMCIIGCTEPPPKKNIFVKYVDNIGIPFYAAIVSVSSDGHYVISSHHGKFVILWDIVNKTHKILSKNANIYSAYFIKGTHDFIWQDMDNIVHVQDVTGLELKSFKNFPVYGQVMGKDLNLYLASDVNWSLFSGIGARQKRIKRDENGFMAFEKLLNITLSKDERHFLTAGFGGDNFSPELIYLNGVVLWDTKSGKPLKKYKGPGSKVNASFSPNAKKIVAGSAGGGSFIWSLDSNLNPLKLDWLFVGHLTNPEAPFEEYNYDKTGLIPPPKEFAKNNGGEHIIAMKYIDNKGHFLRFPTGVPFAILYKDTNPQPLKYFKLGSTLLAGISDYEGNEGFDTAPDKNILVMSQNYSDGILVFKFDPKTQTLTRLWAPTIESDNDITDEQLQEFHNIRTIDSSRF